MLTTTQTGLRTTTAEGAWRHAEPCAPVQVGRLVLALQRQTNNVAEYCGLIIGLEVIGLVLVHRCADANETCYFQQSPAVSCLCMLDGISISISGHLVLAGGGAAGHQAPEHRGRQQACSPAGACLRDSIHTAGRRAPI